MEDSGKSGMTGDLRNTASELLKDDIEKNLRSNSLITGQDMYNWYSDILKRQKVNRKAETTRVQKALIMC